MHGIRKPSNKFEAWENPQIPAGYTYVAQFLAHDCVNSTIPTSALGNHKLVRNGRSVAFELETLYGGGFDGCAHAIQSGGDDALAPSKLVLGNIRMAEQRANGQCPFRDIARSKLADLDSGTRGVGFADDRNDKNVLVSQITVLFTLFHNCVVDRLASRLGVESGAARSQRFYTDLFLQAKSICVAAYRCMIEKDLMARLLHPAVHARYAAADPPFIDGNAGEEITLGSCRRCAWARDGAPHYRVNDVYERRESLIDVLLTTSRGRPWRLPLDETWAVDWSNFFPLSERLPTQVAG